MVKKLTILEIIESDIKVLNDKPVKYSRINQDTKRETSELSKSQKRNLVDKLHKISKENKDCKGKSNYFLI